MELGEPVSSVLRGTFRRVRNDNSRILFKNVDVKIVGQGRWLLLINIVSLSFNIIMWSTNGRR